MSSDFNSSCTIAVNHRCYSRPNIGRSVAIQKYFLFKVMAFIMLLGFGVSANAKFKTTYSVNSSTMQEIADWADEDTIIFVELDDTIIIPKSRMFSFDSNPYRMFIQNLVSLGERMPRYYGAVVRWYQQRQIKLVEDAWVNYIKEMKEKGVTVYGFCSMPIQLVNIEEKRYKEVVDLGIEFTSKVNGFEEMEIEKKGKWHSLFYKGIIFTGPYSKSHTLIEFMKVTNIIPKKMIVVDSVKRKLKRLENRLRIFNMDFYNILYLGAREVIGKPDSAVVKLQQDELIQNGRWLEDDAAIALLESRKKSSE